jgi:osmotically-inducible protein OsmY
MSETTEQIRAGLEHEPAINLHADEVDVIEDDTIRLVGRVSDIQAKRKALRVARESGNTARIHDELRVQTGEPRPDDELADRVEQALNGDAEFRGIPVSRDPEVPLSPQGYGVHVRAADGVVRLAGRVPGINHRRLAEALCWWIPGSADVDDRLAVEPPEEDNDGEISEAVSLVLERDPALNQDEINARVRDAEVTLAGRVASSEQAGRAERNCWYLPGVHEVHNQLEITPG